MNRLKKQVSSIYFGYDGNLKRFSAPSHTI